MRGLNLLIEAAVKIEEPGIALSESGMDQKNETGEFKIAVFFRNGKSFYEKEKNIDLKHPYEVLSDLRNQGYLWAALSVMLL